VGSGPVSEPSIQGRVLNPGQITADVQALDAPVSFWGGYDPLTGEIIDQRHPQAGRHVTGKILVVAGAIGSAGTPAGIAESIRTGVGPVGIVLAKPDVNISVGTFVAAHLYDIDVPVICLERPDYTKVFASKRITIDRSGVVTLLA
jgi:predicted aconitase with swiveling domain